MDVLIIFFGYTFPHLKNFSTDWQNISAIAVLILFWLLLSGRTKLYNVSRNLTYTLYLERFLSHFAVFIFCIFFLEKLITTRSIKENFWGHSIIVFIVLLLVKSSIFFLLKYARSLGINQRNTMFLGEGSSIYILKNTLENRKDYGYRIFNLNKEASYDIEKLKYFWKSNGIYSIFMSYDFANHSELQKLIFEEADRYNIKVNIVPNNIGNSISAFDLSYVETLPVLVRSKFPLDYFINYAFKRTFDILFSISVLIFIGTWLFPIIAILIYLEDKGPVFFIQKRYGYENRVFGCIKFRSMCINNEADVKTTSENDPRITKIGRFIRKTNIDEFPQFLNVLRGEMSVVGPRPHMLSVDNHYQKKIRKYSIRNKVKPGITGLAQVNGLRGDTGADMNLEMKKRILADNFYVKNWSISLDLVIILKTFILILFGNKKSQNHLK